MRFTIVSDSLTSFTGFAKQTRLLASELSRRGHEVIVGSAHQEWCDVPWDNEDCTRGPVEWPTKDFFNVQEVLGLVELSRPDVVLLFRNAAIWSDLHVQRCPSELSYCFGTRMRMKIRL